MKSGKIINLFILSFVIFSPISAKNILIILNVLDGYEFQGRFFSQDVTDKFFNRKNDTNWMSDTFTDPLRGSPKKLKIVYRKYDAQQLENFLKQFTVNEIAIPQYTGIANLPNNNTYQKSSKIGSSNHITAYAIEDVKYGSWDKNVIIDVTDKFTNRPNNDWMTEFFGRFPRDPRDTNYQPVERILYIKYAVLDDKVYQKLLDDAGAQLPSSITLDIAERAGINGL